MSIFNKRIALTAIMLLLVACQSGPQPEVVPAPAPEVQPAPEADADTATAEDAEAAEVTEPEPVDFNQQFYEEAIASLKTGKTEIALELLLQVSADAPEKPYVFTNLGLAHLKLEQTELAEKAFQQAVERNNKDAVAHNHLGILQRQKGQFEDARDRYQRALEIDSNYARAHLNLGILFDIYLQDLERALQHYRRYQALTSEEDSQVAGWIVDIERRLKSGNKAQG